MAKPCQKPVRGMGTASAVPKKQEKDSRSAESAADLKI
jgi:hypothetical protein